MSGREGKEQAGSPRAGESEHSSGLRDLPERSGSPRAGKSEGSSDLRDRPFPAATFSEPSVGKAPSGPSVGKAPNGPSVGKAPNGPSVGKAPSGPSVGKAPSGPSVGKAPGPEPWPDLDEDESDDPPPPTILLKRPSSGSSEGEQDMEGSPGGLGLRLLFILAVMGVLLSTTVVLGWLLIRDRSHYLHIDLEAKGVSLARTLAHHAELGVLVEDQKGLERLIEGLRHDPDVVWAAVRNVDGRELAVGPSERSERWRSASIDSERGGAVELTDGAKVGGLDQESRKGAAGASDPLAGLEVFRLSSAEGGWVSIVAPVWTVPMKRSREEIGLGLPSAPATASDREGIGEVNLVLSTARVEEAISDARWMVAIVIILVLTLGSLITVYLAQVIVGPIQQLARASRRLAIGEMAIQVPEYSSREMADLARSFNEMVNSLRERDARLQENAAELERRALALRARQAELQKANDTLESRNQELRLSGEQIRTVNAELVHASKLKSEFLASMSHELRTPLNSIIGYTECMLDGLDGPISEDQQESLERVQRNGRHLLGLINDILDLSKIESGKLELALDDVALDGLAEECMAMMRPLSRKKEIELNREVPNDLPPIRADGPRVRQILINLLTNAVKFTEKGEVALLVSSVGDGVELMVRDTGCGIPEEQLGAIFQEFHQLEGPNASGTGLGLAITKRLVELMGGTIGVKSEVGRGATFTVWLPKGRG